MPNCASRPVIISATNITPQGNLADGAPEEAAPTLEPLAVDDKIDSIMAAIDSADDVGTDDEADLDLSDLSDAEAPKEGALNY